MRVFARQDSTKGIIVSIIFKEGGGGGVGHLISVQYLREGILDL